MGSALKCRSQDQEILKKNLDNKDFFLSSEGLKCWEVCQSLSDYYDVNILVFDDIKEKEIFGDIKGLSVSSCLDVLSWIIGVEWLQEKGIYFIGGNRKNVVVLDSYGLPDNITSVFKEVSIVGDKVTIVGTEREVKRVVDAIKELSDKTYINVWLNVIEVVHDDKIEFGIEWDHVLKYTFTWANMMKGQFNPAQMLALALAGSLKLDEAILDYNSKINTCVGVLSGFESKIESIDEKDRQTYNESGDGYRVVSGYNTQTTGLTVALKGFKTDSGNWLFDVDIENSRSISDTEKKSTKFKNRVIVPRGSSVLLGIIKEEAKGFGFSKGIPYLSRIPYIGALFSIHKYINAKKDFYVILTLSPDESKIDKIIK